jgi:hypothetical protein
MTNSLAYYDKVLIRVFIVGACGKNIFKKPSKILFLFLKWDFTQKWGPGLAHKY